MFGVLCWLLGMVAERRLTWRCSALDWPLGLLIVLVLVQLVVGNRPLAAWALAPPGSPDAPLALPSLVLALGTLAPTHTISALLIFLAYAGAYVLVIHLIRTRPQLDRLVTTLLILGGGLAFFGLLDYLGRDAWLLRWRNTPATSRLSGTFANPDHFGAWLTMLIFLGIGYLLARRGPHRPTSLRRLFDDSGQREEAIRRYWPFLALIAMAVALVFTLSRGAVVSALVAVLLLLALLRALGRVRRSLALVGALLVATMGYAAWIGFEPLLHRVWHADYGSRWAQTLSSVPMLRSFPLLGVGLGTYQDIYLRYQPAALDPGHVYYTYAHNDLLQLVLELGMVGAILVLLLVWRTAQDLLGAHLLGRATCPVGGGEAEGARRNDPFSVGLGVGALGGVIALLVHSLFDFSARIAANGILAATCLGIATVALHTRFSPMGERLLTRVRVWPLGTARLFPVTLGATAVVLSLVLLLWIARPPLVAGRLADATRAGVDRPTAIQRVEAALALNSSDERARALRGRLRRQAALEIWTTGATLQGRVLPSWEERQEAALPLATGAAQDLQAAIRSVPSEPTYHGDLARAEWTLALLDPQARPQHLAAALAAFSRAATLAPNDPFIQEALATFAVPQGGHATEIGLRAARAVVQLNPGLLPDLVDQFLPVGLTAAQWVAMVPDSALDRSDLGTVLEERALLAGAAEAYRNAIAGAPTAQSALPYWLHARLLLRQGSRREALQDIERALAQDPENPELYLVRAQALAALGDPAAPGVFRLAILKATMSAGSPVSGQLFGSLPLRGRALVFRVLQEPPSPARYHRTLARYLAERQLWYEALTEWEGVLAEAPQDAEAHFGEGIALDGLGKGDRALEAYRRAVTLDGTRSTFRLRLAQRLWATEQYFQAMNEWRSVLGQEPGNIEARLGLARAAAKAGDRAAAAQEYLHILQIVPDQPEARRELARLGRAAGT
ncbi:MAG TPA: O-antigen ligase family protein [Candidatus Dormibacteraeota bacterium]|nr:O-antigen ligase family protein [Candidatus Dormibacteraeota bacterium]